MLLKEIPALPKAYIYVPLLADGKQEGMTVRKKALIIFKSQNVNVPMKNLKLLRAGRIIKIMKSSCNLE